MIFVILTGRDVFALLLSKIMIMMISRSAKCKLQPPQNQPVLCTRKSMTVSFIYPLSLCRLNDCECKVYTELSTLLLVSLCLSPRAMRYLWPACVGGWMNERETHHQHRRILQSGLWYWARRKLLSDCPHKLKPNCVSPNHKPYTADDDDNNDDGVWRCARWLPGLPLPLPPSRSFSKSHRKRAVSFSLITLSTRK